MPALGQGRPPGRQPRTAPRPFLRRPSEAPEAGKPPEGPSGATCARGPRCDFLSSSALTSGSRRLVETARCRSQPSRWGGRRGRARSSGRATTAGRPSAPVPPLAEGKFQKRGQKPVSSDGTWLGKQGASRLTRGHLGRGLVSVLWWEGLPAGWDHLLKVGQDGSHQAQPTSEAAPTPLPSLGLPRPPRLASQGPWLPPRAPPSHRLFV